ncbi:MAG: hypothetical protein ACPG45_07560 [Flavobacteriaceae bacterium]
MKQLAVFLIIISTLTACVSKKIEYQDVQNIKIISLSANEITLSADAIFKNPNILGGKVTPDNIVVFIDNKEITTVKSKEFKVPAVKEFAVPLEVTIPFDKIPGNKNGGLLGAVLGSINKTHQVTFKGVLNYKVAGFKSTYTINQTEELKLSL